MLQVKVITVQADSQNKDVGLLAEKAVNGWLAANDKLKVGDIKINSELGIGQMGKALIVISYDDKK